MFPPSEPPCEQHEHMSLESDIARKAQSDVLGSLDQPIPTLCNLP